MNVIFSYNGNCPHCNLPLVIGPMPDQDKHFMCECGKLVKYNEVKWVAR